MSIAGVPQLQGLEQQLAEQKGSAATDAPRQATGGSKEALQETLKDKASPRTPYARRTAISGEMVLSL